MCPRISRCGSRPPWRPRARGPPPTDRSRGSRWRPTAPCIITNWSSAIGPTAKRRACSPARVAAPEIDETPLKAELPRDYVARLARGKALAVERAPEIGKASGRESGCQYVSISVVAVSLKKNNPTVQLIDTNKQLD